VDRDLRALVQPGRILEAQVTSIFVTHDQEGAFEVSDRVVLPNAGRIEQVGSPAQPASETEADSLIASEP
jgi:ABC-type Fe3+/spermidine/putrescine transport system ATPase subunit